jgi:hypothetical protein
MTCVMRPVWLAGVAMKILSFEFYLKRPLTGGDQIASAPEMISISSLVIIACRVRL